MGSRTRYDKLLVRTASISSVVLLETMECCHVPAFQNLPAIKNVTHIGTC